MQEPNEKMIAVTIAGMRGTLELKMPESSTIADIKREIKNHYTIGDEAEINLSQNIKANKDTTQDEMYNFFRKYHVIEYNNPDQKLCDIVKHSKQDNASITFNMAFIVNVNNNENNGGGPPGF